MSETTKIILGVISGIVVTIIGQLTAKFFIEPLHDLLKVIGEVRFHLSFHAPTIHTPIGRTKEASDAAKEALLKSSSDLLSKLHAIPAYVLTCFIPLHDLPAQKDVEAAAVHLRALSTHVHDTGPEALAALEQVRKRVELVERLLHLKPLE
ncbi:hypothetical protein L4X63_16950 [Geomonas sp. Red32]|uniref:hypothetical protein n=1 Tax=Geomonas sp. Red32 TaxID=2912856 RepID=UPI00202CDB41|nr:hypothetical protein [Geomonas sp. Red32]MCM0083276.1 hypothetical protein [Geomonas sp. Red32]